MKNNFSFKPSNSGIGFILLTIFFVLFMVTSFVVNISKLFDLDFASPYKAEVVRVISVTLPIFPITAWMDIGEEDESK